MVVVHFSLFRWCHNGVCDWSLIVLSSCFPTLFPAKIPSSLVASEIPVSLSFRITSIVPPAVIIRGVVPFIPTSVVSFPTSVIAIVLVVIASSFVIPISAFWSVVVLPPELFFFRFLTLMSFNVPHRCRLSVVVAKIVLILGWTSHNTRCPLPEHFPKEVVGVRMLPLTNTRKILN